MASIPVPARGFYLSHNGYLLGVGVGASKHRFLRAGWTKFGSLFWCESDAWVILTWLRHIVVGEGGGSRPAFLFCYPWVFALAERCMQQRKNGRRHT